MTRIAARVGSAVAGDGGNRDALSSATEQPKLPTRPLSAEGITHNLIPATNLDQPLKESETLQVTGPEDQLAALAAK